MSLGFHNKQMHFGFLLVLFLLFYTKGESLEDSSAEDSQKQAARVWSFDVFDTLVGRLHYDPESVFRLVESNFPYPNFVYLRSLSGRKSNGSLEDVYQKFRAITNISEEKAQELMNFELETELSNIFPIVENVNLVRNGDLIVSDTYYNLDQMKKILAKIGLAKTVTAYISPTGKSSGDVWQHIAQNFSVHLHLGDNYASDVAMALKHSIPAKHYKDSQLSSYEQAVMDLEHRDLACLMRTLRLQNPYPPGSPHYLLWNEQAELNVPLLIQCSLYLDEFCKAHKKQKILFTSRGTCLWMKIFQKMFPEYDSVYFQTSNYVYMHPSSSFIEYVQSIYTENSVIVDEHGSGSACGLFFKRHLNKKPTYFLILREENSTSQQVEFKDCLQEIAEVDCNPIYSIITSKEGYSGDAIEGLNKDIIGSLKDMQEGKRIRFAHENNVNMIYPSHHCMDLCLELLPNYKFQPFDKKLVKFLLSSLENSTRCCSIYLPELN